MEQVVHGVIPDGLRVCIKLKPWGPSSGPLALFRGLGYRALGSGSGVQGVGFGVSLGFGVWGLWFRRACALGLKV